jgi:hypothetical protein
MKLERDATPSPFFFNVTPRDDRETIMHLISVTRNSSAENFPKQFSHDPDTLGPQKTAFMLSMGHETKASFA